MTKQELLETTALYFPHGVKCLHFDGERERNQICTIEELTKDEVVLYSGEYEYYVAIDNVKLILHTLSEFIYNPEKYQEIRDNMSECEFESLRDSFVEFPCKNRLDHVSYSTVTFLIKNHFDVFGLIELGYAVDINTINNGQKNV